MKRIFHILFLLVGFSFNSFSQKEFDEVVSFVLKKFETHDVVAIGERHWGQLDADLRIALIRHPEFQQKVNDILIEFGNSLHQELLDEYVFGGDLSFEEVAVVWRNTTQIGTWDTPIYGEFIKAVREVNMHLDKDEKLRVLAGGQPIDWTQASTAEKYHEQIIKFPADRGSYPVIIAEKEILNKRRKALAIFGHNQIDKGSGQVVAGINRLRENSAYTVGTVRALFGDSFDYFPKTYPNQRLPMVIDVSNNDIGNRVAFDFFGFKKVNEGTLAQMVDAVIYFGTLPDTRSAAPVRSDKYTEELNRRRTIQRAAHAIRREQN